MCQYCSGHCLCLFFTGGHYAFEHVISEIQLSSQPTQCYIVSGVTRSTIAHTCLHVCRTDNTFGASTQGLCNIIHIHVAQLVCHILYHVDQCYLIADECVVEYLHAFDLFPRTCLYTRRIVTKVFIKLGQQLHLITTSFCCPSFLCSYHNHFWIGHIPFHSPHGD